MTSRMSKLILTATAAAATMLLNSPAAQASPETDFLTALNNAGIMVYDANRAVQYGHQICEAFSVANGQDIADYIYAHTSWSDVPDRATAAVWVVAAGTNLCPWHFHPERVTSGYVA